MSSLRLTDEDEDVMVVTVLFAILSRSTSVPLVEVLDKEALSLAIFPELVPIIRGKQSSWVQNASFSTLAELSAKNEDGPMKFATRFSCKELLLNFSLSRPKKQRGGERRHIVGCTLEFCLAQTFNLRKHCCDFDAAGANTVENTSSSAAVGSCTHRLSPGARDTLYKWESKCAHRPSCALTRSAPMPPPMRVNFSRRATFIPQ